VLLGSASADYHAAAVTATTDTLRTRLAAAFVRAPGYAADAADRRTIAIAGLGLPLRASTAIAVATMVLLFDYTRTFIPDPIQDLGRAAPALRYQAIERVVLFGLAPLAVILLAFRDRPSRYGLVLGDWRWGLALAAVGCGLMTPLVLALVRLDAFRDYYAISSASLADVLVTNVLDLIPTEFMIRGFLMLALVRAIGPTGVLVATMPFVFSHLGKPEVELLSTLFGGLVYGWLVWRTGSIVWSAAAHIYIVTLLLVAAGT
jgi:membrane protease YdiL (CAAX protease family)